MEDGNEILKYFDKVFYIKTVKHIKFNNMRLLKVLYEYFEEDVYTPNTKYSELRHKHIEISDKLEVSAGRLEQSKYIFIFCRLRHQGVENKIY